jgi:hypothetical protein
MVRWPSSNRERSAKLRLLRPAIGSGRPARRSRARTTTRRRCAPGG